MQLKFRQGIITGQLKPISFLTISGSRVSLNVDKLPVMITFAHGEADYLWVERRPVASAWSIPTTGSYWLYWDIDLDTGVLTRGFTTLEPEVGILYPEAPSRHQHFFDLSEKKMRVWGGQEWVEVARVFAGVVVNGVLNPIVFGSQVRLNHPINAGTILLDRNDKPIKRYKDGGTFELITTETASLYQHTGLFNTKYEYAMLYGEAGENLPAYRLVTWTDAKTLGLASADSDSLPAIGFITKSAVSGANREFLTQGFVTNRSGWGWTHPANTPLFLGVDGELTVTASTDVSVQRVGYIVSPTTIYIDIQEQLLINPSATPTVTPTPTPTPTPSGI